MEKLHYFPILTFPTGNILKCSANVLIELRKNISGMFPV